MPDSETSNSLRNVVGDPVAFVPVWLDYMGYGPQTRTPRYERALVQILDGLQQHFDADDVDGAKSYLESTLANTDDGLLCGSAVFYYYNARVDAKGALHSPDEFDSLLPDWELHGYAESAFMVNYAYIDMAWQAHAEGRDAWTVAYFERVRETAWATMVDYPLNPLQVWTNYNYVIASEVFGEAVVQEALTNLETLRDTLEPSVLRWCARYHADNLASKYPSLETTNAPRSRYASAAKKSGERFMADALASDSLMMEAKAMLNALRGHVLLGTGKFELARARYEKTLTDYDGCLEWVPRTTNRTITFEQCYGVGSMTAYASADAERLVRRDEPELSIAALKRFVDKYPRSEYSARTIYALGNLYEVKGDLEEVANCYRKIRDEYPRSHLRGRAVNKLSRTEQRILEAR
jgi:tetratricopeptide (TPR) repeat protein